MISLLIIDDNEDSLRIEKLILEQEGFFVDTAVSGDQALELLDCSQELDLILLDMQLGDMSGMDFLIILEKKYPHIIQNTPVVFLTGQRDIPSSVAAGIIHKPVDMDTLIKSVRHYLRL